MPLADEHAVRLLVAGPQRGDELGIGARHAVTVQALYPRRVEILGLIFAGTATEHRAEMTRFVADVLGVAAAPVAGASADMFALPDGSAFAVSGPREMGETSRTVGFLVADVADAVAALRAAGVAVDDPVGNARFRYAHFHAPDGHLYELVERVD
jgi:glyoxylase I family protein